MEQGVVLHLASLIEYTEGGVISKQLIKSPAGNITLFSFDKGEGLSEHRAPFDALVQVLEGVVNITVNGTLFTEKVSYFRRMRRMPLQQWRDLRCC